MKVKMKSADIIKALRARYGDMKYECFEELRLGSGYGFHERRIDFLVVESAPSRGNRVIAFEVKISRVDFRRDIAKESKQRGAKMYSNEFYFIAPIGIIPQKEVPDWAGLVEINPDCGDFWPILRTVLEAPYREKWRPSWPLLVSIARNARKQGMDACKEL